MGNKQSRQYAARVLLQDAISAAVYFASAGTLRAPRAWAFFACFFAGTIFGLIFLSRKNPGLLGVRTEKQENTEPWDRIILPLYLLLAFVGVYAVAGLDLRFGWSRLPAGLLFPALLAYLLSSGLAIWAMAVNRHFESTARIQNNRRQAVCTAGPYRFVRHPGYAAILLGQIALPFALGSAYALLVSLPAAALMVLRTALEDSMLRARLVGYADYAKKVPYRLIPYLW